MDYIKPTISNNDKTFELKQTEENAGKGSLYEAINFPSPPLSKTDRFAFCAVL